MPYHHPSFCNPPTHLFHPPFKPLHRSSPVFESQCPLSVSRPLTKLRQSPTACAAQSLEHALSLGYVQSFGRVVHLLPNLTFPRDNHLRLSEDLNPLVQALVPLILRQVKMVHVHAIFLRGSLATGCYFRHQASDLDLVLLLSGPLQESTRIQLNQALSALAGNFGLQKADIRYVDVCNMNERGARYSVALLYQYALLLYGALPQHLQGVDFAKLPLDELALDIREKERLFLHAFSQEGGSMNIELQCRAIRWICKLALRAVVDLGSTVTGRHCRDLLPSYKIATECYPRYEKTFLVALQCACASESSGFLGLGSREFVRLGYTTARNIVEIVEELCLKHNFRSWSSDSLLQLKNVDEGVWRSQRVWEGLKEGAEEGFARALSWRSGSFYESAVSPFKREDLPELAIDSAGLKECEEGSEGVIIDSGKHWVADALKKRVAPVVFRKSPEKLMESMEESTASVVKRMMTKYLHVECRVSPRSDVTFCRGSHPWISSNRFTPPSVPVKLTVAEAFSRMRQNCELPRVKYTHSATEHIYIQTRAHKSDQLFDLEGSGLELAQQERIWISTHGTVSGLHYDASYSVLLQRTGKKRMIFFSPDCIPYMGIYPLGHPLHRRACVSLSRGDSEVFGQFWERCADRGLQVVLQPGDMIVFPPLWCHYTESIADDNGLSVSHTLRYV